MLLVALSLKSPTRGVSIKYCIVFAEIKFSDSLDISSQENLIPSLVR